MTDGFSRGNAALLTHIMRDHGAPHRGIPYRHVVATAATQHQALQEGGACPWGTFALETTRFGIVSEPLLIGLKHLPRDVARMMGREYHLPVLLGNRPYRGVPVDAAPHAHAAKHKRARIARIM